MGKKPITIYLDAHSTHLGKIFRDNGHRVIETAQKRGFMGCDERDFINDIRSAKGVFVTSDAAFVQDVTEEGIQHTGIIFVPANLETDEQEYFCSIAAGYLQGLSTTGASKIRNMILYPGHDGLRTAMPGGDSLEFSWDKFREEMDTK